MAMRAVRTHLAFRIVWLAFGVTIGIIQLANGGAARSFGLCLSGVGMMLFGGLWFLIPTIPIIPLRDALQASHSAALGSGKFRTALACCALACLACGQILHFGFQV